MKTVLLLLLVFLLTGSPVLAIDHPVVAFPVDAAGFVGQTAFGPMDQPILVTSYGGFVAIFGASTAGLTNSYLAPSVAAYFANGGSRLVVVRVAANDDATIIGLDGGTPETRTGLQALLGDDPVAFIAIPGATTPAVQAAMIAHCEQAGDRMAILDPASPNDLAAIHVQRAGLVASEGHAALYFPWVQAEPTGVSLLLPPSGFVAGWYSAKDPHESPVGLLATVTGVAYAVTSPEQDELNLQNINAIRDLSGIRIWGARTLATDVQWRYVATRRLGLYLDEAITRSTLWCLFEPNEPALWNAMRQDVETFLLDTWADGWLQGATPSEAYFVRCDLSTMTAADLAAGRTILEFGYAAVRPAEFMVSQVLHQREDLSAVPAPHVTRLTLANPTPNPFNPQTSLSFELAGETRVNLRILDLRGRLVRTIVEHQMLAGGAHARMWNGRDNDGRAVGSGVYLVQLQGAGETRLQRIVLVR